MDSKVNVANPSCQTQNALFQSSTKPECEVVMLKWSHWSQVVNLKKADMSLLCHQ